MSRQPTPRLVPTLLALMLAGCGGGTPAPASKPPASSAPAAAPRASATVTPTATPAAPAEPAPVTRSADVELLALTDQLVADIEAAGPDCSDIAAAVERWLERHAEPWTAARVAVADGDWPGAEREGAAAELTLALDARLDRVFTTFALCDGNPDTAPLYERVLTLTRP